MESAFLAAGLALGLAVGGPRALLVWGRPSASARWRDFLVKGSLPLLLLGSALILFWPGNLALPAVAGPLQILAGLAFLLFSHKLLEQAPLMEGTLHFGQDPWVLPADLRPLGAVWGVREEVLAAVLLAPLLALRAQGHGDLAGLFLLAGAWLGVRAPGLGLAWLGQRLQAAALRDLDRPCCLLRPRLYRMLGGLAGLLLMLAGASTLHQGVQQLARVWVP